MNWNQLMQWAGSKTFTVRVNDEVLKLPRPLYRHIGVDHSRRRGTYFESPVMDGLRRCLRPGDCVFDAGSSYGILTCLMARMVHPGGAVHAFEANPDVLAWAKQIVAINVPQNTVHFVHACLADSSHGHTTFFTVPGMSSVASTRNTDILHFHPDSTSLAVPSLALDDYCLQANVIPKCIKIDIEGSEYLALNGARRLLEQHHPRLLIETHGLEIDGIGGNVAELCSMLDALGYTFRDLVSGEQVTADHYAREHARRIGYCEAS